MQSIKEAAYRAVNVGLIFLVLYGVVFTLLIGRSEPATILIMTVGMTGGTFIWTLAKKKIDKQTTP